jgi:hypothetical protein
VEKDIRENNDLSDEKPKLKRQLLEELHHWMDTMNVEKPKPNPDYDREKAIEISKSGQIHDES